MPLNVKNEIGTLKKVLLHRPGEELLHLVPDSLNRLLFDDIPFLDIAQQEHDFFAHQLKAHGVEVVYLEDLVSDVLNKKEVRQQFIFDFISQGGDVAKDYSQELVEFLENIEKPKDLVLKTMKGVTTNDLNVKKYKLSSSLNKSTSFILDPIPNLYFTRDTFASIGCGVSLNKMFSVTRRRESIYGNYIFKYHPDYFNTPQFYKSSNIYNIEGGDILNLTEETLLIGISERTSSEAIEQLALNLFNHQQSSIKHVIAIEIPSTRAFMHLDTVFTQIDHNKFTVHPHIMISLRCFILTYKHNRLNVEEDDVKLEELLAKYLGVSHVNLIYCGGNDSIAAQREQWNDGSNTLCIAPGKVIVYDRNVVTNKVLEDNGITCIKIKSSELSRGRGGPRCMSMPLIRESL